VLVNIDENFVLGARGLSPNIRLIKGNQIESPLRQSVAAESERLRIQEIAVNGFNPAGLAANVPRRAKVTRAILEFNCDSVSRLKPNGL
jgi:hypothetical protein